MHVYISHTRRRMKCGIIINYSNDEIYKRIVRKQRTIEWRADILRNTSRIVARYFYVASAAFWKHILRGPHAWMADNVVHKNIAQY